ncbi:MAG: hypothetical protein GY863_14760 [bacterium]|nr:hypothetical protein [bacterium]
MRIKEVKIREKEMIAAEDLEEIMKCVLSPWYFMVNYVKTFEREKGEISFPKYYYLKELIDDLLTERRLVILKSRQMLVTWTSVAFCLWEAVFRGDCDILFISKREDDSKEAIRRMKFIYDRLPDSFKPRIGENTKYAIEFPGRNSRLMALPTHPNIGRTFSPTRIIWDEMACTPYDYEIYGSLQPSLDGGGYFVGISTSQGQLTKHAELYLNAESMGFTKKDIHYSVHPEKDKIWSANARKGMSDEQWNMEQEMSLTISGKRVYGTFQQQTHVVSNYLIRKDSEIYRSIDFGYHTPVVLWGQVCSGKLTIFYEWVGEDATISEMVNSIIDRDEYLGLSENDVKMTFCDPAGEAQTDQGISSVDRLKEEYYSSTGKNIKMKFRRSSLMAGIDIVREKLKNAAGERNLFVDSRCSRTIADFGRYVKKKDSEEPKKDGVSDHTMDALRYLAVNLFQRHSQAERKIIKPRITGVSR